MADNGQTGVCDQHSYISLATGPYYTFDKYAKTTSYSESIKDHNDFKSQDVTFVTGLFPSEVVTTITYFIMRGRDVDCPTITYRTWKVQDTPDSTGAQYSGTKCGPTNLADIIVLLKITVDA
ncbi:MAG: hypothetical protein LC122_13375 [Chitinophagales bacterium]|nr:hypothetical protein [Chitinophagales bacterium]